MLQKEWRVHTSKLNYWKAHKPVRFIRSYVLYDTQQYKHRTTYVKSTSAIHASITENTEDLLVMCVPHISMRETHNASILNSFHNKVAVISVSAIFMSHTEAIMC